MRWCINQQISTMSLLIVTRTTPKVAPNTKKNYKYKTLTLCVLQNPLIKCADTEAQQVT